MRDRPDNSYQNRGRTEKRFDNGESRGRSRMESNLRTIKMLLL